MFEVLAVDPELVELNALWNFSFVVSYQVNVY